MMRWGALVVLSLLLASACTGAGGANSGAGNRDNDAGTLRVVVSLPVFVSMVQEVGGNRVSVRSIVPPGTDIHTYQPSPGDAQAIAEADVIFVNGLGLEPWLQRLIESAGGMEKPRYELAAGLDSPEAASNTGDAHEHGTNPHLWLDPGAATRYVEHIVAGLSEQDPDGAMEYRANGERYVEEIRQFDQWAEEQIATIPAERRKLVTFHDAFPHFADHFGLELVGVVVASPGREPSAQELATLVDRVRAQHVPAIFVEPQFNPKLAETLAREAGVETQTLYSDTPPDGGGYLDLMRTNVEHVVEGLQ